MSDEPRYDPCNYHYTIDVGLDTDKGIHYTVKEHYVTPKSAGTYVLNGQSEVSGANFTTMRTHTGLSSENTALKQVGLMKAQRTVWCNQSKKLVGMVF